jgi:PTH1 family peptidyl-tRNA hydrolase
MNNSGKIVKFFLELFNVKRDELLIVYDDISIPLESFKYKLSGSSGGHNGINDVISELGTSQIPRLQVGIGFQWEKWKFFFHTFF